jgi:NAD(P)-dependent dehydrogenase (short-subunit alcohol dehydrogenase family)
MINRDAHGGSQAGAYSGGSSGIGRATVLALRRIPLRRPAEPQEQAGVVLFLCSEEASYVTVRRSSSTARASSDH